MINFYKLVKENLHFNRFEFEDTVCLEYSCPIEAEQVGIFSQTDLLVHVLSGKKTYQTINGKWTVGEGQTLYLKKGASIIHQFFDDEYCMLGFFMTDSLITETIGELKTKVPLQGNDRVNDFTAKQISNSDYMEGYFQSMLTYFRGKDKPPNEIIKLKLKELMLNIISADDEICGYFKTFIKGDKPSLTSIMEANYCYNLKLEEFAELSHRSLSSFKRDFQNHYNETPGKWLLNKRLEHASNLLINSDLNVSQVAFESGFEDLSHFSRAFKQKFQENPSDFRSSKAV